jgi:hypothetical protein
MSQFVSSNDDQDNETFLWTTSNTKNNQIPSDRSSRIDRWNQNWTASFSLHTVHCEQQTVLRQPQRMVADYSSLIKKIVNDYVTILSQPEKILFQMLKNVCSRWSLFPLPIEGLVVVDSRSPSFSSTLRHRSSSSFSFISTVFLIVYNKFIAQVHQCSQNLTSSVPT